MYINMTLDFFKYLDITHYTLSGTPGEGWLFSYKAESFLVVFIITAGILAIKILRNIITNELINIVISSYVHEWLETTRFKKKKNKILDSFYYDLGTYFCSLLYIISINRFRTSRFGSMSESCR